MSDPKAALEWARKTLDAAGIPGAARDASRLLDHIQGKPSQVGHLSDAQLSSFRSLVERRVSREPISHLIGTRAFWMHEFIVTQDVLDPRPDTETLVDLARKVPFSTVLDLGTGSGCILLSLLHERPDAIGVGTDVSPAALAVAKTNANRVGVTDRVDFQTSDWFSNIDRRFDLIVSNPPYIARDEMPELQAELSFEPRIALTDESDGLSAYRTIIAEAPAHLTAGGVLMVEIGAAQGADVKALFAQKGFTEIKLHSDLNGRDRVVVGRVQD